MFIGREKELRNLDSKINSEQFEFGIIYGRRRIGKTRLLQEVVKKHPAIYYVANEMDLDDNLKQLSRVVAIYFNESFTFDSFESLFEYLANKSKQEKVILIIDDFNLLMSNHHEILSIVQNSVDHSLLDSNMKFILSGSKIEDALMYKKPLYGRATFKMKIEPFDYFDASKFYPNASNEDKVRFYSVFGGVPFYTSKIDDSMSVEENIISLIIENGAVFEDETTFFLSQEVRSIATYGKIINAVASGATRYNEIATKSQISSSGSLSSYLDTLIGLGIIEREVCFRETINSKKSIYRVKDQFFNFYYNFIERYRTQKVIMGPQNFYKTYVKEHLDEYVSFEFEKICRDFLLRKYRLTIEEIGRYWYNNSKLKQDIEIDVVMKESGKLYVFECKWTSQPIDHKVVKELKRKSEHLKKDDIVLGFFSKNGYDPSVNNELLFMIDDLYSDELSKET